MPSLDYAHAPVAVRGDLVAAHRRAWQRLAAPGSWWTGAERVAIAAEVRGCAACALCRERRGALSPRHVSGEHECASALPAAAVEAVHQIVSDPGRLSRSWFDEVRAGGLTAERYVELLGVVVTVVSIDAFCRGIGVAVHALPAATVGEPTRHRPHGVADEGAWVPTLPVKAATGAEADLYRDLPMAPNVLRALSLVPDEVRLLRVLGDAHYLSPRQMMDPTARRSIDRAQIELVAGRVSARRECFY